MCWKRWLDDFWHFWHLTSLYQGWRPFGWNTSKCGQQGLDFTVCYMPSQVFFYFRQKYSPSTASLLENCLVFTWYWAPGNNEDARVCFNRQKAEENGCSIVIGHFWPNLGKANLCLRSKNNLKNCKKLYRQLKEPSSLEHIFDNTLSKMHCFSATSIYLVS